MSKTTKDWNGIDTAPKDGTVLLLHNVIEWSNPIRGYWNSDIQEWSAETMPMVLGPGDIPDPTHWLPVGQ